MKNQVGSARPSKAAFTLIEIMIVVAIMALIVAIATPVWMHARTQSRMKTCQENLTKISGAKEQFALEMRLRAGAPVLESDIVNANPTSGYLKMFPREPSGYSYSINVLGVDPTCNSAIAGHSLTEVGLTITVVE